MKIRIVEVTNGDFTTIDKPNEVKCHRKYYKLQTSWLGWIWWDQTEPEYGFIYPTFDTLEAAEEWVNYYYLENERVVREFDTKKATIVTPHMKRKLA